VTESGVRFDYTYDVIDELIAKSEHDADPANAGSFSFDGLGRMLTNQPSDPAGQATLVATSYEYDPAGHLTLIDTGSAARAVRFGIDALGRHAEREADQVHNMGDLCAAVSSWVPGAGSTVTSLVCYL
jgi:hypothetical protein